MAVDDGRMLEAAAAVTGGVDADRRDRVGGIVLRKRLGAFLPLLSLVRIAIATGAALGGRPRSCRSTAS